MFQDPLTLIAAILVGIVVLILLLGLGSFAKGGEFDRRHANRFMRWRIIMQFVAVVFIVLIAWLQSRGGR